MSVDVADFNWVPTTQTRSAQELTQGGMIEPATIAASLTVDYNPPGLHEQGSGAGLVAVSASVVAKVSGIMAPPKRARGIWLLNIGSFDFVLLANDAGSAAANRILMPTSSHVPESGGGCYLYYFPTSSRWVLISTSGTASIPGGGSTVCITRAITSDRTIASGITCLQRNPEIALGVVLTIDSGGELLLL